MDDVSYFKLQAKNLYRDFKLDFMQDDDVYNFSPRFFDINRIMADFDIDSKDFSLMKAQHIIAKLVGLNSWDDLLKSSAAVLERKKEILEHLDIKVKKSKRYNIDLSGYEKIAEGVSGDYVLKCPKLPELEEISELEPNCCFLSCNNINIKKLAADTEHVYVNVVTQNSTIRVLVKGADISSWYAVSVKNIF